MIEKMMFEGLTNNYKSALDEIKKREGSWRALHIDYPDNDISNPKKRVKVTFVNGSDDYRNSTENKKQREKRKQKIKRLKELKIKCQDNNITHNELVELINLKGLV